MGKLRIAIGLSLLSLSVIAPSTAGSATSFGTYKCRAAVEFRGEPFNQFYVWTMMSAHGACVTVSRRFSLEVTGVPPFPAGSRTMDRNLPGRTWLVTTTVSHPDLGSRDFSQIWEFEFVPRGSPFVGFVPSPVQGAVLTVFPNPRDSILPPTELTGGVFRPTGIGGGIVGAAEGPPESPTVRGELLFTFGWDWFPGRR